MSGRERILAAFGGCRPDGMPVAICYMSLYMEERVERAYVARYMERLQTLGHLRLDPDEDVLVRADAIQDAYTVFRHRDDWMPAFAGPDRASVAERELILEDGQVYEVDRGSGSRRQMRLPGQVAKSEELRDYFAAQDARLARRRLDADLGRELLAQRRERRSTARSDMRLVQEIARAEGQKRFVYAILSAPFVALYDLLDFDGMMLALLDAPSEIDYLMQDLVEETLENAAALREAGVDGIWVEECLASADLISPTAYARFALPFEQQLLDGLRHLGLSTIFYFCGDVMPRLPFLRDLPLDALAVEESKKGFVVDIGAVREAVGPRVCLVGNLDAYGDVRNGSASHLRAEVSRQAAAAGPAFIAGIGSPLTLDTPAAQVDLLVEQARAASA